MNSIFLVDDDQELCQLLTEYLEPEGFKVDAVNDGRTAVDRLRCTHYDMVVLDVMLPELNGFDVLRALREFSHVPVLMLTARGEDVDRIVGLEMGADDYLPKPCNPRELLARIKAIMRRVESHNNNETEQIRIGDLIMDGAAHAVKFQGKLCDLTSTEYKILEVLIENVGRVVEKFELSEKALERKMTPYDRSIDMHISNLRAKLNLEKQSRPYIRTVRGVGYILTNDA